MAFNSASPRARSISSTSWRDRSTMRAKRFAVLSPITDDALVSTAGATISVSSANRLLDTEPIGSGAPGRGRAREPHQRALLGLLRLDDAVAGLRRGRHRVHQPVSDREDVVDGAVELAFVALRRRGEAAEL